MLPDLTGEGDAATRRDAAVRILGTNSEEGTKALLNILTHKNNAKAKLAICEAVAQVRSQAPAFKAPLLALLQQTM